MLPKLNKLANSASIFLIFVITSVSSACVRPVSVSSPSPSPFRTGTSISWVEEHPDNFITQAFLLEEDLLGIGQIEITFPLSMKQWESDYIIVSVRPSLEFGKSIKIVDGQAYLFNVERDAPDDEREIVSSIWSNVRSSGFQIHPQELSYYSKPITSTATTNWVWILTPEVSGDKSIFIDFYAATNNQGFIDYHLLTDIPLDVAVEPSSNAPVPAEEPFEWKAFLTGALVTALLSAILAIWAFYKLGSKSQQGDETDGYSSLLPAEGLQIPQNTEETQRIDTRLRPKDEEIRVHKLINQYFDENDLKIMSYALEVEYGDLPGETKSLKAIELIKKLNRQGEFDKLLGYCRGERPHISWE